MRRAVNNSTARRTRWTTRTTTPATMRKIGLWLLTTPYSPLPALWLLLLATPYSLLTVSLQAQGTFAQQAALSGDTTLSSSQMNHLISATAGSSGITLTLPAAASWGGSYTCVWRVDSAAGNITISRAGSDTINGATSITLPKQYQTACFTSDGAATWEIVSGGGGTVRSDIWDGITGFRVNGAATSGRYLKGDGTNFVQSAGSAAGAGSCANQAVTANNSDAAPTCTTLSAAYLDASVTGFAAANTSSTNVSGTGGTDQQLAEFSLLSGELNTAAKTLHVHASGTYTIGTSQTPTINLKVKLCTVTGCGSGTVVTLLSCTSGATTSSVTNAWQLDGEIATAATGSSGTLVGHTICPIAIGSSANGTATVYDDTNTGASSAINLTGSLFLDFFINVSTQSGTKNSFIWFQASAKPVI